MKFLKLFFATTAVAYLTFCVVVWTLIDVPIRAEYWVSHMIMIKPELVKKYAGQKKIIIAGGSSALFGFDAEYASNQLNMPVINYGLHAGLGLERILQLVRSIVEPGDLLVLALEPNYFDCKENKLSTWEVENIIGWDHDYWRNLGYMEKIKFVTLVSSSTFAQMILAAIQREYYPASIEGRILSLDKSIILDAFRTRPVPVSFEYSAANLDNNGDILITEGAQYTGQVLDLEKPGHVCANAANQLISFADSMKKKEVRVYLANVPYISQVISKDKVRKTESSFQKELIAVGCFIDKREDLALDRKYFFNSNLHLNSEGRLIRTDLFIDSIRKNVFLGGCQLPLTQ